MRPGEIAPGSGAIEIAAGRQLVSVVVRNTSQWCVQVTSHMHFFEVNHRLKFDRRRAFGMRLAIPAGRATRWEPGQEREVRLVPFGGGQVLVGFNGLCDGPATPDRLEACLKVARSKGFLDEEKP
jgi:urease beta subunit